MKKSLLDVMFASEKRKNVLLLLKDGPVAMEEILQSTDTTRQALLPQIRILEEHHLVSQEQDKYRLTNIGKLIVDTMIPVIETAGVLDTNIDYWGTHNLDFIPDHLLKRIEELYECNIINIPIAEMYELPHGFEEESKSSKAVFGLTTVFHPNFTNVYEGLTASGVVVSTIISKELFQNLMTNHYNDLKKLIESDKINLFIYSMPVRTVFFVMNDFSTIHNMLTNEGKVDHNLVVCHSQRAVRWSKELFEHYLRDSSPLDRI